MRRISADFIYTLEGKKPLRNHVISLTAEGEITQIQARSEVDYTDIEHFPGAICPGFINAHCHLELSHLLGQIPTGKKLIPFITDVVTKRDFPQDHIQKCIKDGDQQMWEAGIQAVGDISNTNDTFATKAESKIYYHTFVELFDLLQSENAQSCIEQGIDLVEQAKKLGISASITPHAPYSVSKDLLDKILTKSNHLSIHNQETEAEDQFFQKKEGDFIDFYTGFNLNIAEFQHSGKNSLPTMLEKLKPESRTLFIHNSFTPAPDLIEAESKIKNLYWCTCPNANLYIENRLPDYPMFVSHKSKMVVGTDSLSSNWKLSILEELKTIRKYQSWISTFDLMTWACKNGAEALGLDKTLGTLTVGKSPGIIHLTTDSNGEINDQSVVQRLF